MVASLGRGEVDVDLHAGIDVQGGSGGTHREWTTREKNLELKKNVTLTACTNIYSMHKHNSNNILVYLCASMLNFASLLPTFLTRTVLVEQY